MLEPENRNVLEGVSETAAIAVPPPGGGPARLVIYVVLDSTGIKNFSENTDAMKAAMQKAIKETLNPLFKITDLAVVESLPRTASNKVMRRVLRDQYSAAAASSKG